MGELAASLDLDEVTQRTLEAASTIEGVEAALLDTEAQEGSRLNAAVGMPVEEAAKSAVQLPDNDNLRAVEIVYRYRIDETSSPPPRASARASSCRCARTARRWETSARSAARPGTSARPRSTSWSGSRVRAGEALQNARKYAEARALADLDALTGLHNRRFFHETLAREVAPRPALPAAALADRLRPRRFKAINDRAGHPAGDAVLAAAAERMRRSSARVTSRRAWAATSSPSCWRTSTTTTASRSPDASADAPSR